jgi:phospholipase C
VYSIGYYKQSDLAFLGAAAPGWTVCDNYFAAILAETYPSRLYQHAAQTDRIHNSTTQSALPTVWDRLAAAGLAGKYYFNDLPFLALWGTKYLGISRPFSEFLADSATGNLPQVSFIAPRFEDETSGTSNDDHPHADIRNGEAFLNEIYRAVTSGPNWPRTLLTSISMNGVALSTTCRRRRRPSLSPTSLRETRMGGLDSARRLCSSRHGRAGAMCRTCSSTIRPF